MNILANNAMRFWSGERDVARHLSLRDLFGAEAEGRGIGVSGLYFELAPVDGAAVQPWRCSGLEPAAAPAQQLERFTKKLGRWPAAAPGRIALLAPMNTSVGKGSGRVGCNPARHRDARAA